MSRLEKVISGGQTGVEQAALRAAREAGLETGGYAPKGWLTEDDRAPSLADWGLVECRTAGYPARTRANVRAADGTLRIGTTSSTGFTATRRAAVELDEEAPVGEGERTQVYPWMIVEADSGIKPSDVAAWIEETGIRVLNLAGNRESVQPGIGRRAEVFLTQVFRKLA